MSAIEQMEIWSVLSWEYCKQVWSTLSDKLWPKCGHKEAVVGKRACGYVQQGAVSRFMQ